MVDVAKQLTTFMKYIKSPSPVWLKEGKVEPVNMLKASLLLFTVVALMVLYFAAVENLIGPMPLY